MLVLIHKMVFVCSKKSKARETTKRIISDEKKNQAKRKVDRLLTPDMAVVVKQFNELQIQAITIKADNVAVYVGTTVR